MSSRKCKKWSNGRSRFNCRIWLILKSNLKSSIKNFHSSLIILKFFVHERIEVESENSKKYFSKWSQVGRLFLRSETIFFANFHFLSLIHSKSRKDFFIFFRFLSSALSKNLQVFCLLTHWCRHR